MKANPEKFQFMILSKKSYQRQKLSVNTFTIDEFDDVELLGLTIDKELNLSKHIDKLCCNAQYKQSVQLCTINVDVLQKGKIQIHKTLNVIYQSNKTYKELLELSGETVSIHQQHLRFLVTEVYTSTSYLNLKFMCSFFTHKEIPYNLRKSQVLSLPVLSPMQIKKKEA